MGALYTPRLIALADRNPSRIGPLQAADAQHIAHRLREWDRREVFALMPWHATPDHLAETMLAPALDEVRCVIRAADGEPVAATGFSAFWPGTWQAWLMATDRWREVWRLAVQAIMAGQADAEDRGMRRAECRSMAGHEDAHRLLRWLGYRPEGEHPAMGRAGETFQTFARLTA